MAGIDLTAFNRLNFKAREAAQARPKASALDHLGSAIEYTDRARRTIAQARHAIDEAAAQSPKELVGSVNGPDPDAYADLLNPAPEASAQQGTAAAIELDRDSAAKQYRSFELVMESIAKKHEAREKARQTQTTRHHQRNEEPVKADILVCEHPAQLVTPHGRAARTSEAHGSEGACPTAHGYDATYAQSPQARPQHQHSPMSRWLNQLQQTAPDSPTAVTTATPASPTVSSPANSQPLPRLASDVIQPSPQAGRRARRLSNLASPYATDPGYAMQGLAASEANTTNMQLTSPMGSYMVLTDTSNLPMHGGVPRRHPRHSTELGGAGSSHSGPLPTTHRTRRRSSLALVDEALVAAASLLSFSEGGPSSLMHLASADGLLSTKASGNRRQSVDFGSETVQRSLGSSRTAAQPEFGRRAAQH